MAFDAQLRLVLGVSLCLLLVGHSGITRASSEGAGSGPRGEEEDAGSLADRSAQIIRQQDAEEGQVTRTAARTGVTGSKDKTALCSMPLAPTNGRIEGADSDLSLGSKVHVLCEVGYTLIGPSELTCNAFPYPGVTRGWWQPQNPYACTPEYPVQEPADEPETEIEETNHHLQLGVEDSSFCGEPHVPENGFIEGANFDLGGKVRIRCEPGYTLNGPSLLTCEAVSCHMCGHGLWAPQDEYSCTRSLSAVESNMVELHSLNQDRWNEPGPRYTVLRQESNSIHPVRAQLDSDEDVKCRTPTPPYHGHLEGTDYSLYATVTIVCDPGYNLLGQDHITCLPVPDPFRHIGIWEPQEMLTCRADPPSLLPAHLTENSAIARSPLRNRVISSGLPSSNQVEGLPSVCSLTKVVGPCKAAFPRFYFDRGQMECIPFTYGGCRGNANNFETLEECQHACR